MIWNTQYSATSNIVLLSGLVLFCSLGLGQTTPNIKDIFIEAGNDLAAAHRTAINPLALSSGFCFARDDPSEHKDKCVDEPTSELACSPSRRYSLKVTEAVGIAYSVSLCVR